MKIRAVRNYFVEKYQSQNSVAIMSYRVPYRSRNRGRLEGKKYLISEPSCTIIPEGIEHGPIVTKKVDGTYGFYSIRLDKGDSSEFNPA